MTMNLNPSNQKMNMTEKRMAFYAHLLDGNRLKLSADEAAEWRRDLPRAIEAQYFLIDKGCLPVPMTLANIRRLKTLDVSNENSRVVQWEWERGEGGERDGASGNES